MTHNVYFRHRTFCVQNTVWNFNIPKSRYMHEITFKSRLTKALKKKRDKMKWRMSMQISLRYILVNALVLTWRNWRLSFKRQHLFQNLYSAILVLPVEPTLDCTLLKWNIWTTKYWTQSSFKLFWNSLEKESIRNQLIWN